MALPAAAALKDLLKIEHDAEDDLLARVLASARGAVEALLDRPIEAEPLVAVVDAGAGGRTLRIPVTPVKGADPAPVVRDVDGALVDPATYRLAPATGVLTPTAGSGGFCDGPYTITATVGLETRADYERVVEPAVGQAILDLAADYYQRRSASAAAEGAGGGVYTQYAQGELGIPPRVREALAPFRRVTP